MLDLLAVNAMNPGRSVADVLGSLATHSQPAKMEREERGTQALQSESFRVPISLI